MLQLVTDQLGLDLRTIYRALQELRVFDNTFREIRNFRL